MKNKYIKTIMSLVFISSMGTGIGWITFSVTNSLIWAGLGIMSNALQFVSMTAFSMANGFNAYYNGKR